MHMRVAGIAGLTGGLMWWAASAGAEVSWERVAVPLPQAIYAVEAIDTDGDGRRELIAIGGTQVFAVRFDAAGKPVGEPRRLATTLGGSTIHAVALDCDGDGDLDLALGRASSDWIAFRTAKAAGKAARDPTGQDWTVAWLENTGKPTGDWPLHVLDRELHGVHGVWVGDVDGDGSLDLLADSFAGPHLESSLAWFRAPRPGRPAEMPRQMITTGEATGRPHYLGFADLNGDGRGDVLLGASAEGRFTWWEQPSDLAKPWRRHEIATLPGATHPRPADLNGDGRLDVIGSAGHGVGVFWFAAPDWARHDIDAEIRDVHAFDAADIDGDGDTDAAGCTFSGRVVVWYENLGRDASGVVRFRRRDIDVGNNQEAYDLKLLDLDGDGRRDVLLAGRGCKNVVWYRNRLAPKDTPAKDTPAKGAR